MFKADVLPWSVRSTIEVGRCQSSFAYCEAEFDLGKGKNRSKAPYTAIPYWTDRAELTNDPGFRVNQK